MMKLKPLVTFFSAVGLVAGLLSVGPVMAEQKKSLQNQKKWQDQGRPCFPKPRFADLDLNQDSFVTLEEFKQKEIPHGDHETVFDHIDADGNGEITEQEFESHRPPKHRHKGQSRVHNPMSNS